jgi:hypothetical protein
MPRERRPFFVGLPPSRGAVRFFLRRRWAFTGQSAAGGGFPGRKTLHFASKLLLFVLEFCQKRTNYCSVPQFSDNLLYICVHILKNDNQN